ncbi:MAG TPA: hypothetical protein VK616_01390, partial [Flavitalea sp.]|nr:hypothetical protein [Flavitalea sp.]
MRLIYIFLLAIVMTACSKKAKEEVYITTCPEPTMLTWLTAKKADYQSCTCLAGARQGIFKNQPVIEFYLYDPLCNGVNQVYK